MATKKEYQEMVKSSSKNSEIFVNCIKAFFIGGFICLVGQVLITLYMNIGFSKSESRMITSISLVFLGVLLTALRIYDNIAKHAGAGTLVPITGFANSIAAPAIEFKTEGWITGVGAKMFVIAGPVLVYGVGASFLYGLILWILKLMGFDFMTT